MNTSDKIILVTGATGQQGGATARHLLKQGWRVRALSRDTSKPAAQALAQAGVELVAGNFDNRASLDAALDGVYGVFSVQGFWETNTETETRQGIMVADAASAAGVRHMVYTSVGGADRNTEVPHFESKWQIEQHIRQLGLPATIIRPVEFMENYFWSRQAIITGTLMSQGLRPERKKHLIAVDDIGAFAALAFEHPDEFIGTAFELSGDALTERELAETFTEVIGRPVQWVAMTPEIAGQIQEELLVMWKWFDAEGYQADIDALRRRYPLLKTFETWLRETGWQHAQPDAVPHGIGA